VIVSWSDFVVAYTLVMNRDSLKGFAVVVSPRNALRGELSLPGDKSISHRAAMIAALARGKSTLENFSSAEDCQATLECLRALGVTVERNHFSVVITGVGPRRLQPPGKILDAQNSGTTMRLLAGILAGQPFATTITGDESLLSRPMLRVAEPLRLMGAKVEVESNNCAPLRITGQHPLQTIRYRPPIASAQIKSAVLLAAIAGGCEASVAEPIKTRDHTERLLKHFGAVVRIEDKTVTVTGGELLQSRDLVIPGDISSAAFFIAGAIALPGSEITVRNVGINSTRTAFVSKLIELGANIDVSDERIESGEPVGTLRARGDSLKNERTIEVFGSEVSGLIDELPLLAFLAAGLGCGMELRDASELRVKESDRIAATVENLTRMGARIAARGDGWTLEPGSRLQGAQLNSFGDHRIAMSCAVAALTAEGASHIEGGKRAVAVSLPEFWSLLDSVAE
jgi:3-phosphoshikimate 1-carboxyvinyltransferase